MAYKEIIEKLKEKIESDEIQTKSEMMTFVTDSVLGEAPSASGEIAAA